MTYDELDSITEGAWSLFLEHLSLNGLSTGKVVRRLEAKDCFNDVFDAIISTVKLEEE